MELLIRTLDQVDASSVALVGGKCANLGELVGAGVPVPEAFCVTTVAYRRFLAENQLPTRIVAILGTIDYENPTGIEQCASAIRALLMAAPIPADIEREIISAYEALEVRLGAGVSVSVRSSATAEDLPGTSFAGQQDTYLHMSGSAGVVDAVKRCWASLWTGRAVAYRHVQGFAHESVLLAVVVQEMFPSEVSGVMFTANPVTSNPRQFFLNTSWGLGEAVVSGQVNPDQLIVAKGSLHVVDRQINDKLVMTAPHESGQGSSTVAVPEERRRVQSLPDDLVRELCQIGQRIEDHYGFPQDIEWGHANGRFAILQAREITGANLDFSDGLELWKTPAAFAEMYDEKHVWSRAFSDEVQTGPSTPSFYTYLQLGMTRLKSAALRMTWTEEWAGLTPDTFLDFPYFRWYGARAYYNLTFERERVRRFIPPFARDEAALWPFPDSERDEIRNLPFDWTEFMALLRRLHDETYDVSLVGSTRIIYENLERWTDDEDTYWRAFDLDHASVEEIFAAQIASRVGSRFGENVILPFTVYLFVLPAALQTLCAAWFDDADGSVYNRLAGGHARRLHDEFMGTSRATTEVQLDEKW